MFPKPVAVLPQVGAADGNPAAALAVTTNSSGTKAVDVPITFY